MPAPKMPSGTIVIVCVLIVVVVLLIARIWP